jgi:guanylate kinase
VHHASHCASSTVGRAIQSNPPDKIGRKHRTSLSGSAPISMNYSGNLFVVAAPSGSGKSTLVKALMEVDAGVVPSISHTTREPRGHEKDGREYFFVDDAEFQRMIDAGQFLEWAQVHGHRYGTSRQTIETCIQTGCDVVLEIDWQGALQIRKLFAAAILIFVLPPSLDELRLRLQCRGEDAPEVIDQRMVNARKELAQVHYFDYVIINTIFERALFDLKAIVHAQRLRYATQKLVNANTFATLHIN